MGIDVMIVGPAEDMASRPSEDMFSWLEGRFDEFDIRYGCVALSEGEAQELRSRFENDPVGSMLISKIEKMRASGDAAPYVIELMMGW